MSIAIAAHLPVTVVVVVVAAGVVIAAVVVGIVEHRTGCCFPLGVERYRHRLLLLLLLLLLRLVGNGCEKVLPMSGGHIHRRMGNGIQRRSSSVVNR